MEQHFRNLSNLTQLSFCHHCLDHSKQLLSEGLSSHGSSSSPSRRTRPLWLRLYRMKSLPWRLVPLRFRQMTNPWLETQRTWIWNDSLCSQLTSQEILPYLCLVISLPLHCQRLCCLLFASPPADHLNSFFFSPAIYLCSCPSQLIGSLTTDLVS